MALCHRNSMPSSVTISCACKSIVARIQTVIGKVHRQRARCLAPIPIRFSETAMWAGALHSYRRLRTTSRNSTVNAAVSITTSKFNITNQVGERLSDQNQKPPNPEELSVPAEELIVQVDGGHIPTKIEANGVLKLWCNLSTELSGVCRSTPSPDYW